MKVLLLTVLCMCVVAALSQTVPLPKLNIDRHGTTTGGLSAGAFMAVQFHVAYSKDVSGAAIFAGGPYHCAQGNEMTALTSCMSALPFPPDAPSLESLTATRASLGLVDYTTNLTTSKVFMFSGTLDSTVNPKVMAVLYNYYTNFVPAANIEFVNTVAAAHTQPTDNAINTNPCWLSVSPYISNCNYDGAGAAFAQLYGKLNPRTTGSLNGSLIQFDQTVFWPQASSLSMADTGYAYIPAACAAGARCRLHMNFHGCSQNFNSVGLDYVSNTGYNQWADSNNIVIVYPQTIASYLSPSNPQGCFDWWGYNNNADTYDTNQGAQMMGFKAILDHMTYSH